jgi:hypothetical protein
VFSATGDDGTQAAVKFVPKVQGAQRELLFADLDGIRNVFWVLDSGEVDEMWVLLMPARSALSRNSSTGPRTLYRSSGYSRFFVTSRRR